jgi:hypothetical protein
MLNPQPEAAVALRQYVQHLEPGGDHLDADAVAGDRSDSVFAHLKFRDQ